jgi:putative ABC transport system substrate-binding protein
MNVRTLVLGALAASLLVAPLRSEAQTPRKVYRVGYLTTGGSASVDGFRESMRAKGYVEGRNLVIESRIASGQLERLPQFAAELVAARVDLIVAASPPAIRAAQGATTTIPIVMAFTSTDPVQDGFVKSLARPGGNVTGVAIIADELAGKRLQKLKEALPRVTRIAILAQAGHSSSAGQVRASRQAAAELGIEVDVFEVRGPADYEQAFAKAATRASAIFILANPAFAENAKVLAALAIRHRLAALCEWKQMVAAGCFMSYGPVFGISTYERQRSSTGSCAARLRQTCRSSEPNKFDLSFNLDTAKALSITIPKALLQEAVP